MPKLDLAKIEAESLQGPLGAISWRRLSDAGGLTQWGLALETLQPGARSSDRHWHEDEDEFVYVLEGELTVCEDSGETRLGPGGSAAFPAGHALGHCLKNQSDRPARYLIIGTRADRDRVHSTTIDKILTRIDGRTILTRRDGTPLEEPPV